MSVSETAITFRKARIVSDPPREVVSRWLRLSVVDFRNHLGVSLIYGICLFALGWILLLALWLFDLGWMILPALAGGMLVGPIATIGLYQISRRAQGNEDGGIASPGQIFLAGAILMVFALTWIRAATLIFAVFFGLLPFSGFAETLGTLLATPQGIFTVIVGSIVGGLFAALGFAVSVFSIPMLIDREMDCFSAMGLSFNATTYNFRLMIYWAVTVSIAILIGMLTGLVGLIFIFPILGYATWHAYCDLFQG